MTEIYDWRIYFYLSLEKLETKISSSCFWLYAETEGEGGVGWGGVVWGWIGGLNKVSKRWVVLNCRNLLIYLLGLFDPLF